MKDVDVVLWLVEPTTFIGAGERHIAEQLNKVKTPVHPGHQQDRHREESGGDSDLHRGLQGHLRVCGDRSRVGPEGERTRTLVLELIFKYLPYGPQFYDEDTVTDQPMRQIAAELIREKALRLLDDEIPHGIAVTIEKMTERQERHHGHRGHASSASGSPTRESSSARAAPCLKRIGTAARAGDREHAGDQGEPAALGQGEKRVARQRPLHEELRVRSEGYLRQSNERFGECDGDGPKGRPGGRV